MKTIVASTQIPHTASFPTCNGDKQREMFSTYNPADSKQIVASYETAHFEDHDALLELGNKSFPGWSRRSVNSRVEVLGQWLDRIIDATEDIAIAMTAEQGKPLQESRGEIGKATREARQMLAFALSSDGAVSPGREYGFRNIVMRRPRGVVAAIAPWNFPVLTPLRKLIPALVTGNCVILKPSEYAPSAAFKMLELSKGVLPEGVLMALNGGGVVAARLVADTRVKAVSFTGSVEIGRKIAQSAGVNLTPVSLELGGKNGAIIDYIDDLDSALDAIIGAACQCSGQRCTSISRVIANDKIFDRVEAGLVARLQALVPGEGMDPSTNFGPITTQEQLEKIDRIVRDAVLEGAVCVTGGAILRLPNLPNGRFFDPTLLKVTNQENSAIQQEIFGPVLTLQRYYTDDEALNMLNDVEFGLTSAIFTDRLNFASRALDEAQSGMIHVNQGTVPDDNMPFSGIKNSGLGIGSVGKSTLDFFTTEHAAYISNP